MVHTPGSWKQLAKDQPSWRSAIHTAVAHSEQLGKERSERIRLARKRDNGMPVQFQPLLNSDVTSVREFASPKLDCIVTGEPMVLI